MLSFIFLITFFYLAVLALIEHKPSFGQLVFLLFLLPFFPERQTVPYSFLNHGHFGTCSCLALFCLYVVVVLLVVVLVVVFLASFVHMLFSVSDCCSLCSASLSFFVLIVLPMFACWHLLISEFYILSCLFWLLLYYFQVYLALLVSFLVVTFVVVFL